MAQGGGPRQAPPAPVRGRDAGSLGLHMVWLTIAALAALGWALWAWAALVVTWCMERADAITVVLQLVAGVGGIGGLAAMYRGHVRYLVGGLTTRWRGATTRRPATNGDRGRDVSGAPEATREPPLPSAPIPSTQTDTAIRAVLDAILEIRDGQLTQLKREDLLEFAMALRTSPHPVVPPHTVAPAYAPPPTAVAPPPPAADP